MIDPAELNHGDSFAIFRPELDWRAVSVHLPVYLRSLGYCVRYAGAEEIAVAGSKDFVELFWGVDGEGEFFHTWDQNGASTRLRPGCVFHYLPGEAHHFIARSAVWRYRWLTFDGPLARELLDMYALPRRCFVAAPCPRALFDELRLRLENRTPFDWRMIFAGIAAILAQAAGTGHEGTGENTVKKALAICHENCANPNLNVNALAARLGVGRTTLLRMFRKQMGMTPSEYLWQVRLQVALTLLEKRDVPVKEIAGRCGFLDMNYFCRFLRKRTGMTATRIRSRLKA